MATGLIKDNMPAPAQTELTPDVVKQNIKMPPELQTAYEKVVIAGMKIMFDKASHRIMLKELQQPGKPGEKLGKGIAGLMMMMFKESNKTMPPAVIIPAGMQLLMEAAEFAKKSGLMPVTNQDIGEGVDVMLNLLIKAFGVDPQKINGLLNQYSNQNVNAAAQQMGA